MPGPTRGNGWFRNPRIAPDRELEIEPNSRRLVASCDRQQRFELEQGTIHALIWAPPGKFVVDTPVARTIDLGCRYTLQMSRAVRAFSPSISAGSALDARVWSHSFLPAPRAKRTQRRGSGTPWFSDAPDGLTSALAAFDAGQGSLESDSKVDRPAGLAGKKKAIYAAWDALGLGSAEIWRSWKRDW